MTTETREVKFRPAFHRCDPSPSKNYGIGSVLMTWILRRDGWAMTWEVMTDWGLPDDEFKAANPTCTHHMHQDGYPRYKPMGGAVDWHAPVPMYEDQEPAQSECCWIDGPCYMDSGFTIGGDLFTLLCTDGGDAVWARLGELLDGHRGVTPSMPSTPTPPEPPQ